MKTIKIVFAFLVLCACYNPTMAQSSDGPIDLNEEVFKVSFKIGPDNQLTQVSFKNSNGKELTATILDNRELAALNLQVGTYVSGNFRFNGLSGTDLGSSRVYGGMGTLAFDKVMKPNGQLVGCPPLCTDYVKLAVRLKE